MDAARNGRSLVLWLLLAVLAVGFTLRVQGLARDTITHAEVYVPRIAMPDWVSAPPPRPTLSASILGTLNHDNHPPGYYAFMWAWTGAVGTGLFAIRLPSVLVGTLTIALLYALFRRREGEGLALLAAALLALHGHQIFWSQQARMWVFLGFLGVASVLLLQSLRARYRPATAAAYAATVVAGLWFEYTFWPFFAAQIVWELLRNAGARRMPATVEIQVLALVLASPVLVFLKVHVAMDRTAYLARTDLLEQVGGFLLFQWLLRPPEASAALGPVASLGVIALLILGVALLVAGILASPAAADPPDGAASAPTLPRWAGGAAALVATLVCFGFIAAGERRGAFALAAALPWLLLAAGEGAARTWPAWSRWLRALRGQGLRRRLCEDAATLHTLLPLATLLLLSLTLPSVASRSLLFLTPFALVLVARGVFALTPWPPLRIALVAGLLGVGVVSVAQYKRPGVQRPDYQGLAAAMLPLLQPEDAILINDDWYTQPMHYYLPPDRFRTGDFGAHLRGLRGGPEARPRRVWVVVLDAKDVAAFQQVSPHLRQYRQRRRVTAGADYALLLESSSAKPGGS